MSEQTNETEIEQWDHDSDEETPTIAVGAKGVLRKYGQDMDVRVSRISLESKLLWVRITDPYTHGYGLPDDAFRWLDGQWKHVKNPNYKLTLA